MVETVARLDDRFVPNMGKNSNSSTDLSSQQCKGGNLVNIVKDAKAYIKKVKEAFRNDTKNFEEFLLLMKDFKDQRIDVDLVAIKVKWLFRNNLDLIVGFNTFLLEEDKRIENHLSSMMEDALHFIKRIQALPNGDQLYIKFLCMLNKFRKSEMSSSEVYQQGASILQEHDNLLENFKHFLHPSVKAPLQQHASSRIDSSEVHFSQDERSYTLCMTQSEQIEKREATITCHANQCLITDHHCSPNLDKALMTAGKGQREHVEKKILKKGCKRTVHLSDDEYLELDNKKCINSTQHLTKKQKFAQSINDSVSEKLHQEYLWEEGCLARQRANERECSDMHYTFCCKSYADHNVPLSSERKECEGRPTSELVLSNYQDCDPYNPSYRHLQKMSPISPISWCKEQETARTEEKELDAAVLNDELVIVRFRNEDHSSQPMCKSPQEEVLFTCEDEMFEMDLLLERAKSTINCVEEMLLKMDGNTMKPNGFLNIDDHLSILNIRFIEQVYGKHGLEMLDMLCMSPSIALPQLLARLKHKQEEWLRFQSDCKKIWVKVFACNH